jgi:hypothetical protein
MVRGRVSKEKRKYVVIVPVQPSVKERISIDVHISDTVGDLKSHVLEQLKQVWNNDNNNAPNANAGANANANAAAPDDDWMLTWQRLHLKDANRLLQYDMASGSVLVLKKRRAGTQYEAHSLRKTVVQIIVRLINTLLVCAVTRAEQSRAE